MKFRTEINPHPAPFLIDDQTRIITGGSCFAEHTGNFLKQHWFNVRVNPFGTMFNPHSLANILDRVVENRLFSPDDIFYHDGQWKSFELYTLFNHPGKDTYLARINDLISSVRRFLKQADIMILTYGTAQIFVEKQTGKRVANCHKIPASRFEKQMLTADEIYRLTEHIYATVRRLNPVMKFIFSVSPVRYLQDGLTANAQSKARLLDAVISFTRKHKAGTYYFPAYEIFTDDLRDYRFYAADLIHPGEQGIRYVTEIFTRIFFDNKGKQMLQETEKLRKMIEHRFFDENSTPALKHKEKIIRLAVTLQKKYPGLKIPSF